MEMGGREERGLDVVREREREGEVVSRNGKEV